MVSLGIFSVVPLTEPCCLRLTQPLKVSTRDFSWGKGSWRIWLTTYHPCSAKTSRKSVALTYPEPLGPPQPVTGHLYLLLYSLIYAVLCFTLRQFTIFAGEFTLFSYIAKIYTGGRFLLRPGLAVDRCNYV